MKIPSINLLSPRSDSCFDNTTGVNIMSDFSGLIKNNIKTLSKDLEKAEKLSKLSTIGEVGIHELATLLNETELKLKLLISIRDSLVSMIQELNRTQI